MKIQRKRVIHLGEVLFFIHRLAKGLMREIITKGRLEKVSFQGILSRIINKILVIKKSNQNQT